MKSGFRNILVVAALLLLATTASFAQTTGRIDGRVVDDSGTPLPGVTLAISSDSLQGERVEVSGANGSFRFLGVPVGNYKLVAQLEGMGIAEIEGLKVRLDKAIQLEVNLPSALEETIVVTSDSAALIDSLSTTGGLNLSSDLVSDIPTGRGSTALAFLAPGVVTGGLVSQGVENPTVGGASAAENRYIIDGLDTTDPAFGTVGTSIPTSFIKETEVKTGGYNAEYGGALGGIMNVITKSGGNTMTGDVFGFFTDGSLQSSSPRTASNGQFLGFEEQDFGAALGGKLVEDKVWFFAAADYSDTAEIVTTRNDTVNLKDTDIETLFFTGKVTTQPTPSNQLVFSVFGDPTDRVDVIRNVGPGQTVGTTDEFGAINLGATFNSTLNSSVFLEAALGRYDEDVTSVPFTESVRYDIRQFSDSNPGIAYMATNPCGTWDPNEFDTRFSFVGPTGCSGGTFAQDNNDRSRDEVRGNLTFFAETGSIDHELKFGGTARKVNYRDNARYPGPVSGPFFDENGGSDPGASGVTTVGVPVDSTGLKGQRWLLFDTFGLLIEYDQNSEGETKEQALYLQDSVRVGDYVTLNLGVRADSYESSGGGIDPDTGEFVDVSAQFPTRKIDFGISDMIAPRIGFTADVARNGKSKLYGHTGRFYESVPLDINARMFGTELFNFYYFYYPTDGSLPTASNPGTHFYSYILGTGIEVDPDMKAMYTEESLIGFEYGITDDIAIGIKYSERSIHNVIEDISVDGGQTYFLTNPGGTFTSNPATGAPLAEPTVFPPPTRDYEAIELTLNKRFSNNWQFYASYVNSENKGNYGGLFRQDNGQLDPNITSLFDLPSLLIGAEGLLPNDREHQFKMYGSYLTPVGLSVGWFGQYITGTPISQLGAHPIYGANERFVTPRGTFGRTSELWNVDLHLEYPLNLGGSGAELRLIVDVFNVTDQANETAVEQEWTTERLAASLPNECGGPGTGRGTACPLGNGDFGKALAYQQPQTLRFGVQASW